MQPTTAVADSAVDALIHRSGFNEELNCINDGVHSCRAGSIRQERIGPWRTIRNRRSTTMLRLRDCESRADAA